MYNVRSLGEDIVILYVGSKRKRFHIHKKLLCDRSLFFQNAFKSDSNFKEATEGAMYLLGDDPDAFDMFVNWLYRDQLPGPPVDISDNVNQSRYYRRLQDTFFLAEKYCINTLNNIVIDRIQDFQKRRNRVLNADGIRAIYANTHQSSKFRLYAAATTALVIKWQIIEMASPLMELAREITDYGSDFMKIQFELGSKFHTTPTFDPRLRSIENGFGSCYFHTHYEGEVCFPRTNLIVLACLNALL
jgi:hypothetical protein